MARFFGDIGYGDSVETAPGVWDEVITVKKYYGDLVRNTRRLDGGDKVNNDISISNSISIVADPYANMFFHKIKFVTWMGTNWTVTSVDVQYPRLILDLGGVYNGPTGPTPNAA